MAFTIVQNDTAPPISSRLADSGVPVDLTDIADQSGGNVRFHMEDQYENVVVEADLSGRVSIVDAPLGEVEYTWRSDNTTDVGTYEAEWQVLYTDGKIETFPTDGKITVNIVEEIA